MLSAIDDIFLLAGYSIMSEISVAPLGIDLMRRGAVRSCDTQGYYVALCS